MCVKPKGHGGASRQVQGGEASKEGRRLNLGVEKGGGKRRNLAERDRGWILE